MSNLIDAQNYLTLVSASALLPIVGSVLYQIIKSPHRNRFAVFMATIMLLDVIAQLGLATSYFFADSKIELLSSFTFLSLGLLCPTLWNIQTWAFCFKYWQTTFELRFLFRYENEQLRRKNKAKFLVAQSFGYFFAIMPAAVGTYAFQTRKTKLAFYGQLFYAIGQIYFLSFFVAAKIHLSRFIRRVPVLRRTERFLLIAGAWLIFILVQAVSEVVVFYLYVFKHSETLLARFQASMAIVCNFVAVMFILTMCWVLLKLNKPLMTRHDLETGQNLTTLMFIRSKIDMQKLFNDEEGTVTDQPDEPLPLLVNG